MFRREEMRACDAYAGLSDDIRQKLIFDLSDAVFEDQFFLFEAFDEQLIRVRVVFKSNNFQVERPVLGPQPCQFFA